MSEEYQDALRYAEQIGEYAEQIGKLEARIAELEKHLRIVCSLTVEDGSKKIVAAMNAAEAALGENKNPPPCEGGQPNHENPGLLRAGEA